MADPQTTDVYTICFQRGTDCEVVAVRSRKDVAIAAAKENASVFIALQGFSATAAVIVRGAECDEVWIDIVENDGSDLATAIYTVNRLTVDGPSN